MNALEQRFTPQVCAAIVRAGGTALVRFALSGRAPAGIRDAVLDELGQHFYREVVPALPADVHPLPVPDSAVGGDPFPQYVGTLDGYYVTPNSLFMKAFARFPADFSHDARVVDLGSGTGRNGLVAALAGAQVTLLERSAAGNAFAAQQARTLGVADRVDVVTMSMQEWAPAPASADAVVTVTTLEHLDRPARQQLATTIQDALTDFGVLVASAFLDDDPGATGRDGDVSDTAGHVVSYLEHGELADLFSGLEVVHLEEYRKLDLSHGRPHYHSRADLIARRR